MSALFETDRLFFGAAGLDPAEVVRIVDDALVGADDGELFLEHVRDESFVWDDGRLKKASGGTTQGFGFRAVAGASVGYAHGVALDARALRRAAETVRAVRGGASGTLALPPGGTNTALYEPDSPLESAPFAAKTQLLQDIDAYLRARDPRAHQVSARLGGSWQAVQILRPGGARVADLRPLTSLHITVVARQGDRLESGSAGGGGRGGYERLLDPATWKAWADEALRQALVNLEAVPAPAGAMTVVLGPGWPAVLLHEAVGHGLEGDFNRKKTSVFSGLRGQRVAAPGVTVVDDGTLPNRRGSLTVDDEGTPTRRTVLIEDGILVGLMQDRLNARLMGEAATGNGRRESFAAPPLPRMTNTLMLGGAHDPAEIIASVQRGLYAPQFGGGQVDITSGQFVFSATEAYEIQNGKMGRPVKGASLIGTGFETLKRVTMIGNDLALDDGIGTCGKDGQSVPVGVGQPTLRIDDMVVGGTEG